MKIPSIEKKKPTDHAFEAYLLFAAEATDHPVSVLHFMVGFILIMAHVTWVGFSAAWKPVTQYNLALEST